MYKRVTEHLQRLVQYLNQLDDIKKTPESDFVENSLLIAATERYLQLAIEACINIGNRILSIEQFNKPVKAPESCSDIFTQMERIGMFDKTLSESLINMAKFRNQLVHLYWDVNPVMLYNYLNDSLDDIHSFISHVNRFYR